MPATSPCPRSDEYRQLLVGQLPSKEVESLAMHLEGCSRCCEVVQTMPAADTLDELVREAEAAGAELPHGPVVEGLIARVCQLGPPALPAGEATRPEGPPNTPPSRDAIAEALNAGAPDWYPEESGWFGPYLLVKKLGSGGMGVVFEANEPQLKRTVAVKTLKRELAGNEGARRRFLREAQSAAAVEHDHIVPIYQVGEDRGLPFLVMKLLQGQSLEGRLTPEERMGPGEILRIGREVATGLAAAHKRGLIHRDIKPNNIWLEEEHGRVRIVDFGLARPVAGDARLTQGPAIVGTPHYMAPEAASGKEVDHRCDLYSLGCVLYRMCTGRVPFPGKDPLAVLSALAVETPPAPRKLNAAVPPALSDLIMKLLAKDPSQRPASAQAVVDAIAAIERQQALRGAKRSPRRLWPVFGLAAGLLVAVALAGYFLSAVPGLPSSVAVAPPPAPARGALFLCSAEPLYCIKE